MFRIYSKNHRPGWVWNIDPFLTQPRKLQVGEVVLVAAFVATIAISCVPQQNTSGHYSTHSYYRRYSGIVGKGIFYIIWVEKPEWYIEDKYFRDPTWKVLHLKMVCVQDIWGPKVQGNPNEVTKGFYIYI